VVRERARRVLHPLLITVLFRFWVLLRWKEDGETLIFGHAPHFAHEIAHEEEHLQYKPGAK